MLKEYVKKGRRTVVREDGRKARLGRGTKIGVLVGDLKDNSRIVIGHSKWHQRLDKYDLDFAESVALSRLDSESKVPPALSIAKDYLKFVERCKHYFKTDVLSENTQIAIDRLKKNLELCAKEHSENK